MEKTLKIGLLEAKIPVIQGGWVWESASPPLQELWQKKAVSA